ncbi:rhodanese-like domain-containing protein [Streptococcus porcinus]
MMKTESIMALADQLAAGSIELIDVREKEEFALGHVPSAVNPPLSQLDDYYQSLSKDKTLHIICQSGHRSQRACEFLATKGYHVVNVEGGMVTWLWPLEN